MRKAITGFATRLRKHVNRDFHPEYIKEMEEFVAELYHLACDKKEAGGKGWAYKEWEQRSGVSYSSIYNLSTFTINPTAYTLWRLCRPLSRGLATAVKKRTTDSAVMKKWATALKARRLKKKQRLEERQMGKRKKAA